MIKRTISIENPGKLSIKNSQLLIEQDGTIAGNIPVEDIGVLIIDNPAILYTHTCLTKLLENNAAVIICGPNHHPAGLLLPLDSNSVQSERFRFQIEASLPLKKQLWKQTIQAKVLNQAGLLKITGRENRRLTNIVKNIKTGDASNVEAQAARYYWPELFGKDFRRERYGKPPNNLLNYGYMVLRAAVARSLVSTGLLPTLSIHHKNKYNAFGLADDIMEPYRVYVDKAVHDIKKSFVDCSVMTKDIKKKLLEILVCDVELKKKKHPLLVGLSHSTASLYRCFAKEQKEIDYPLI